MGVGALSGGVSCILVAHMERRVQVSLIRCVDMRARNVLFLNALECFQDAVL